MSKASFSNATTGHAASGRGAVRQDVIVRELRGQIVRGHFEPGHRLPSRIEIEQQFGASTMTVQRALATLKGDGFVVANRGDGTYVSEHPPHLSRYAIVFPSAPGRNDWSRFWAALGQQATVLQNDSTLQLPLYYNVNEHHDSEDYARLVDDVRAHRVAGLVFAAPKFLYQGTPLLDEPGIPRVEFVTESSDNIPAVSIDNWSLIERSLNFFRAQNRQRVAFLMAPGTSEEDAHLFQAARERGLQSHARWCHRVCLTSPATARSVAHLMFHPSQAQRPDALLIGDDNLVEQSTLGVADAGVKNEVSIIAHCNFPYPPNAVVPVTWLGFDARKILAICLQSLEAQREGQATPQFSQIVAQFENELTDFEHPGAATCNGGASVQ